MNGVEEIKQPENVQQKFLNNGKWEKSNRPPSKLSASVINGEQKQSNAGKEREREREDGGERQTEQSLYRNFSLASGW